MRSLGLFGILVLFLSSAFMAGPAVAQDWKGRLYTPTQFVRLGDLYFIVDCWHNRVLYSPTMEPDISRWKVLDDDLAGPHSIDTNGRLYVVEDTGRHSLRVYLRSGMHFKHIQTIENLSGRPHRVIFDKPANSFYVIGSTTQTISRLAERQDGSGLDLLYTRTLPFLEGAYTRSMTIIGEKMLFVSGPGKVIEAAFRDDSYRVLDEYPVPEGLESMNDLFYSGNYYYLTATPARIIRVKSLEDLRQGIFEDIYEKLGLKGTPYYLYQQGRRIFVPQITQHSGIVSFREDSDEISDLRIHYDYGLPTEEDQAELKRLPK